MSFLSLYRSVGTVLAAVVVPLEPKGWYRFWGARWCHLLFVFSSITTAGMDDSVANLNFAMSIELVKSMLQ